jgi:tetratricopeptide (TPR) repeat protein
MFYGRAEEIIVPKLTSIEELSQLRKLVEKLITLYQKTTSRYNKEVPVFNEFFVSFEMYATNISFYITQKTLGYEYTSYEKNISKKFCNKSTIEKLTYLIDYIESSISRNLSKSNEVVQDKKISATGYVAKISSPTTSSSTDIDTSSFTTSEQWLQLGKSEAEKGLYSEAISHFNQATKLNPNNAEVWYFKAKALDKISKTEEAGKCFEKALSLNLDQQYMKEALKKAEIYVYSLEKYEETIKYNNELIKLDENHDIGINLILQAKVYFQLGKYEETNNCCDKIITRSEDWSNTIPLTLKGFVLVELSRLQEAIECYNKSLDLAPQWNHDHVGTDACKFAKHYATVTNLNYGLALDILGKQEAATKEYEKTIEYLDQELNSDNAECPNNVYYFLKAMTYSKLRKLKEANECYVKQLRFNLTFDKINKLLNGG